jgi:hypothetical protein
MLATLATYAALDVCGVGPEKSLTAVEVDRKVAVRYADEMRAWMHLLRATWVELRAKNRQRRLTEPELTWL